MIRAILNRLTNYIKRKAGRNPIFANTLGIVCLVLIPFIGPLPGPGGIPLFLAAMSLLALHNPWAARLKKFAQDNASSLTDLIFLDNSACRRAWDIFVYLSLASGIYLFVVFDFGFIMHTVITTTLGFVVIAWFRNRHRWRRFLRYFNTRTRLPGGHQRAAKAITLYQPWASLVAHKVKTFETRSWRPPAALAGQRIAIHAGKRVPAAASGQLTEIIEAHLGKQWQTRLPLGAVVATAKLGEIKRINSPADAPSETEALLGDYTAGRWMWELKDIRPIEPPRPARGRHKFWTLKEEI